MSNIQQQKHFFRPFIACSQTNKVKSKLLQPTGFLYINIDVLTTEETIQQSQVQGNSQESLPNSLHISVAQVLIVYARSSRPTSQETQEMKRKIFALPQTGPSQTVLQNATVLQALHTLNSIQSQASESHFSKSRFPLYPAKTCISVDSFQHLQFFSSFCSHNSRSPPLGKCVPSHTQTFWTSCISTNLIITTSLSTAFFTKATN